MSKFKSCICVLLFFAVIISVTSCQTPKTVTIGIPNPEKSADEFFDSICSGDYKTADKYLMGVSLQINTEFSGPFSEKLYNYLLRSYKYKMNDDLIPDGNKASLSVEFTAMSPELLAGDLKKLTTEIGKSFMNDLNEEYTEEKDGVFSLTDEGAEHAAVEALDSLMQSPEKYYETKHYDISMFYKSGKWYIDLSDELYKAISGGFDESD